jgi:hypothetical protein
MPVKIPTVPKTPNDRNGVSLYGLTQYGYSNPPQSVSLKFRVEKVTDISSQGSKMKSHYMREGRVSMADNVRPIIMGKRL